MFQSVDFDLELKLNKDRTIDEFFHSSLAFPVRQTSSGDSVPSGLITDIIFLTPSFGPLSSFPFAPPFFFADFPAIFGLDGEGEVGFESCFLFLTSF